MKPLSLRMGLLSSVLIATLLFAALPIHPARAATIAELQTQIQTLMVQVAQLQQLLASRQATSCPAFSIDMRVGNSGSEVIKLQNYLIGKGYAIPAGATGYFGEQTRTALAQFQGANGVFPNSGMFGPLTRAKIQSLCVVTTPPVPTPPTTPTTPTTPTSPGLQGDASFERFNATDGEDTDLEEGQRNAEVLDVSFRVRHGDARIDRIELGFEPSTENDELDPWDTFDSFTITHDGDEIATIDASRERNWSENKPSTGQYTIRTTGVNFIVEEGDTVTLTVEAKMQNSIDGTEDSEIWSIFIPDEGIRGIDADRVAVYTGNTADATTLNIDEAGSNDELLVRRSDNDPTAGSIRLEEDRNSGWKTVFVFDLDTDDSRNDIEIREIPLSVTLSGDATLSELIRGARLTVDGQTFTDETVTDGAPGTITFSLDNDDLIIDAGDRVEAVLELEFKPLLAENEGTTLTTSINASAIDAEGEDDLTGGQLAGAATSETHTLITRGIDVTPGTTAAVIDKVNGANNDYITLTINTNVSAYNQDVYIPTGESAVDFLITDSNGNTLTGTSSAFVDSSARERNGYFFIPEGSTDTFTLEVTYRPGFTTTARLQLEAIHYNATEVAPNQTWNAIPESNYRTPARSIID